MVRSSASLGEDLAASSDFGGRDRNFCEFRHIQQAGTTACQQDSAGIHQLHRQAIEIKVFVTPLFDFGSTADQLGRIQNNNIKLATVPQHVPHIAKDFGLNKIDFDLIEVGILPRQIHSLLIQFHSCDVGRLTQPFGLQRKAAGVAAKVQDRFPAAKFGQLLSIVPLIAVKACFVPTGKTDSELCSVLHDGRLGRTLGGAIRVRVESFMIL